MKCALMQDVLLLYLLLLSGYVYDRNIVFFEPRFGVLSYRYVVEIVVRAMAP